MGALIGVSQAVGSANTSNSFNLPGTDTAKSADLLERAFPDLSGESDTIVWRVDSGSVRDKGVQDRISGMLATVEHLPSVTRVASPYTPEGAAQISADGRTAYATVRLSTTGLDVPPEHVKHIVDTATSARTDGLRVELGGEAISQEGQSALGNSALIGIVAAAVVLLIAFGSVLAMLLPIGTAVVSLVASLMTISLVGHSLSIPTFATLLAALIGLGVGTDYALFIVTRHRNGLRAGLTPQESAVRALNTTGRSVIFAGATVCVAMLGLLLLNEQFLTGIAISAAIMVAFTVLASTTLLPALLGFLGMRVLRRRERRDIAANGPRDTHGNGFWARWAAMVARRPAALAVLGTVIVATLAAPVLSIELGATDQGNSPRSSTTRKAYDLLADGFGPGFNGPLTMVAEVRSADDRSVLANLATTVGKTPGVARASLMPLPPNARIAIVEVIPATSPQDSATVDLIKRLRTEVVPRAEQGHGVQIYVGGQTAAAEDFNHVLNGKFPLFLTVIVGLSFVLLLVAFRSLVVPLTAAVMNLLAAVASFGVVVAIFQWGWGSEALGLGKAGPVESFMPVIMTALLFGLSMDYQVFLVSRMHEEWTHTRHNRRAVIAGVASTGRVITAAATIMICVFLAFVFGGGRQIAEFGIGLSAAILLDAFVLRTLLVPALMHLFGRANWWLPKSLDRWLPHLAVEPADDTHEAGPAEPQPAYAGGGAAHRAGH